jgi:TonB-dependent receptor
MTRVETKIVRKPIKMTALSIAVAQVALAWGGVAHAQTAEATDPAATTVIVTGQRAAMQSATKLKQYADEVIDAVVAEEAGKLPDRSITEVLQRVAGVTIDRNNRGDPEHFNVEGTGISVRGLTWGSSTLNGRESFSAGWPGRELSWGDVPPELMSAVVVHKNPPAELIEGGVSGQVDLRTALPFDYKDSKVALSVNGNYNALGSKKSPGMSGLASNRWKTRTGEWGALIDLSANETNTRNDTLQMDAYYPRTNDLVPGKTVWIPRSAEFRTNTGKNTRAGIYGALQWKSNDKSMESALTYFHSGYRSKSQELATFSGVSQNPESPYLIQVQNPVYDKNGVLQKGTMTLPIGGAGANQFADGGLAFNSNTGGGESRSQTREIAWNFKWNVNDQWSFQNDVQWVHATDSSNGYNITLATFVPRVNIDMTGGLPQYTYDAATRAFLADRNNYYVYNIMPTLGKSDGDLFAWKADGRFRFDNHPVLRDLRFGVRLTQRTANHYSGGDSWKSIAEPWAVLPTDTAGHLPSAAQLADSGNWQPRVNMGYFSDPRYGNVVPTTLNTFPNFFNGKVPAVPAMVAPTQAFASTYPASYAQMVGLLKLLCEDGNTARGKTGDCSKADGGWTPLNFDGDPSKVSRQKERTQAVYSQLRFGFDELRFPVEGNVGVRVTRTKSNSNGFMKFNPSYSANTPPSLPQFGQVNAPIQVKNQYIDVLPSLNLKADLTDKVQTRFAFAKSMYRPSFGDLKENIGLSQQAFTQGSQITSVSYTGSDDGNGRLKPIRANSFDWTLEWYPGNGSSLTFALFRKNVSDIILKTGYLTPVKDLAGNAQNFLITGPDNVAKGSVTGAELAGQTYFNNVPGLDRILPDWAKGFGVSANYTYIDSKQTLYHPFDQKYCPANGSFNNTSISVFGCDTNGLPFNSMPLQYLSRNAYNLMFLYDRGPVSARLAYSWRGRFLQAVGTNGTGGGDGTSSDPARAVNGVEPKDVAWGLPTWQEATGMLDFGIDYKFTDHMTGSFSASNLTDVVVRQTQQQGIGNMGRAWFEPGRSYRVTMRYSF